MHGNYARQSIVKQNQENSSPLRVTGKDTEKNVPVWRKVSTLAWCDWGISDIGIGLERAPLVGWSSLDRDVISYRIRAYASIIYVGIVSVGRQLNLWRN